MAPFRVIIVGGSIAGLALANMLEQYEIDYVLLEKYPTIAPQVGAGFAIQPNGARILQQLGCYKPLEAANEPVNSLSNVSFDGSLRMYEPEFGRWQEESHGSKMRFMDRRKVIETLFENLRDKSKILTSREVIKLFSHSDGVEIETGDGTVFHGDLVVGADGVHSRVRREIQRIAAEDTGRDLFPEDDAFTCEYRAIFGISKAPEGIVPDQAFKWFGEGRNYLCAPGPNGTLYWIFDMKNEEKTQGKSILRYTENDIEEAVTLYRGDVIKDGVTFGDLFDNRIRASMVPVEEGILKTCFYKRIVLLGDSWHKVGYIAIQSAATLANELKDAIIDEETPSEARLGLALGYYQKARQAKSLAVVEHSHQLQKMEALETPVTKFIQLKLAKYLSPEIMANATCQWYAWAPRLKHLPLSPQSNFLPFADEIKMKPKRRSKIITLLFALFLIIVVFLLYPHLQQKEAIVTYEAKKSLFTRLTGLDKDRSLQLHYNLSITIITAIISIESYRMSLGLSLLGSALPFGIASIFVGWEFVAPAYFALFVFHTGTKSYYYPCPRSIDLAAAQAFVFAYLVNYIPPIVCTFACSTFPSLLWSISHATLPLAIRPLAKWIARRSTGSIRGPAILWGDQDMKYTTRFFSLMSMFSLVGYLFSNPLKGQSGAKLLPLYLLVVQGGSLDPSEVRILLLDLIMMAFLCFIIWDTRRINASNAGLSTILLTISNALLFGPAVALANLWSTRETEWEASRQRQERPIDDKVVIEKA
ncbi:uncharacterized protein N7469_004881 [Penicillium citrinum]|uniref:FAD-binding domain-containing protein n=1 Tax=Penicillium citrinum TaxID=5077 RepID=A0A9W9P5A2_PENCI|nr:uncharacterized protein N7469_004881 [Penicillium citrinum]KAJ5235713.1 hypothetical protein N7469_004881 [Penicillium citrinum]